ncbi:MAG TPA: ABC transporter permease [Enteractinococcus helveticum]|uniref:ABC transporter permease n=1 Tax=Enteractinococcus helveticum TaxID=1837282 RepID=A0A921FLX7_9MICC|nr:ABC transporter permease [Enteractinococcus helveticum]HJF14610.1 ABC transporter permease [Enteractinococcus helveticum]
MKKGILWILLPIVLPVSLFLAWWISSANADSIFFPPLQIILDRFQELWLFALFGEHVIPSLLALGVGLSLSIVIGVSGGVILGLNQQIVSALDPVLQFFRYLPAVALLPLAIQLIGIGMDMRIAIIVFGALWPVLLNTIEGVRSVHPSLVDVAKSYQIRMRDWIFRMVLPSAAPQIFAGIRACLAVAVILMFASELMGSSRGIGYFILEAQRQFAMPEMWSGMILLGIVGYLLNVALMVIERRALSWHQKTR